MSGWEPWPVNEGVIYAHAPARQSRSRPALKFLKSKTGMVAPFLSIIGQEKQVIIEHTHFAVKSGAADFEADGSELEDDAAE